MSDFLQHIATERDRLTKKKTELTAQLSDLQTAIASLDRELHALDAYERARNGKTQTRKTTHKATVLQLLKDHKALAPKEIKAHLGDDAPKGLHNLLATLKKKGDIKEKDGKYMLSPPS